MSEQQNVSVTIVFVDELFSGRKAISGKASNSSEVHVIQRVHAETQVTYLNAFRNHV